MTNIVINGDFETGDFTHWDFINYGSPTCTVQSEVKHSGTYAAKFVNHPEYTTVGLFHPGIGAASYIEPVTITPETYFSMWFQTNYWSSHQLLRLAIGDYGFKGYWHTYLDLNPQMITDEWVEVSGTFGELFGLDHTITRVNFNIDWPQDAYNDTTDQILYLDDFYIGDPPEPLDEYPILGLETFPVVVSDEGHVTLTVNAADTASPTVTETSNIVSRTFVSTDSITLAIPDAPILRRITSIDTLTPRALERISSFTRVVTYCSAGSTLITIPANCFSVDVAMKGAGGAGARGNLGNTIHGGMGGYCGKAGTSRTLTQAVTPGQQIWVTVGTGGYISEPNGPYGGESGGNGTHSGFGTEYADGGDRGGVMYGLFGLYDFGTNGENGQTGDTTNCPGATSGTAEDGTGARGGGKGAVGQGAGAGGPGGGGGAPNCNGGKGGTGANGFVKLTFNYSPSKISTDTIRPKFSPDAGRFVTVVAGIDSVLPKVTEIVSKDVIYNKFGYDSLKVQDTERNNVNRVGCYTTAGSYTITIPPGVTQVTLDMVGGGGRGQASSWHWLNYSQEYVHGHGGSAGARVQTTVAVTPGQTITVVCGGSNTASSFGSTVAAAGTTPYSQDWTSENDGTPGAAGTDVDLCNLLGHNIVAGAGQDNIRDDNSGYYYHYYGGAGGVGFGAGGGGGAKGRFITYAYLPAGGEGAPGYVKITYQASTEITNTDLIKARTDDTGFLKHNCIDSILPKITETSKRTFRCTDAVTLLEGDAGYPSHVPTVHGCDGGAGEDTTFAGLTGLGGNFGFGGYHGLNDPSPNGGEGQAGQLYTGPYGYHEGEYAENGDAGEGHDPLLGGLPGAGAGQSASGGGGGGGGGAAGGYLGGRGGAGSPGFVRIEYTIDYSITGPTCYEDVSLQIAEGSRREFQNTDDLTLAETSTQEMVRDDERTFGRPDTLLMGVIDFPMQAPENKFGYDELDVVIPAQNVGIPADEGLSVTVTEAATVNVYLTVQDDLAITESDLIASARGALDTIRVRLLDVIHIFLKLYSPPDITCYDSLNVKVSREVSTSTFVIKHTTDSVLLRVTEEVVSKRFGATDALIVSNNLDNTPDVFYKRATDSLRVNGIDMPFFENREILVFDSLKVKETGSIVKGLFGEDGSGFWIHDDIKRIQKGTVDSLDVVLEEATERRFRNRDTITIHEGPDAVFETRYITRTDSITLNSGYLTERIIKGIFAYDDLAVVIDGDATARARIVSADSLTFDIVDNRGARIARDTLKVKVTTAITKTITSTDTLTVTEPLSAHSTKVGVDEILVNLDGTVLKVEPQREILDRFEAVSEITTRLEGDSPF